MKRIIRKLNELYTKYIECMLYVNWFNPLVTIYLNFRSFPLQQAIKFPVFVYGWPRLYSLYGWMRCENICKTGMIRLNMSNAGAPQYEKEMAINNWGGNIPWAM